MRPRSDLPHLRRSPLQSTDRFKLSRMALGLSQIQYQLFRSPTRDPSHPTPKLKVCELMRRAIFLTLNYTTYRCWQFGLAAARDPFAPENKNDEHE
jgi:hypothetical protein